MQAIHTSSTSRDPLVRLLSTFFFGPNGEEQKNVTSDGEIIGTEETIINGLEHFRRLKRSKGNGDM